MVAERERERERERESVCVTHLVLLGQLDDVVECVCVCVCVTHLVLLGQLDDVVECHLVLLLGPCWLHILIKQY